jgi:DNA modification methylase
VVSRARDNHGGAAPGQEGVDVAEPITWTNEKRRLSELIPWEENPRALSEQEAARLRDSFQTFGYSQLIEIEPDGEILDGHQRDDLLKIMPQYGPDYEIEVRVASRKFTRAERKKYIAYKHKGASGHFDWNLMANLYEPTELVEWGWTDEELAQMGIEPGEEEAGTGGGEDPGAEESVSKADELQKKWSVVPGQVWKLGEHRLICGSSTDRATVERLMDGDRAEMVWTDPPYGVAVGDKNKFLNSIAPSNRVEENLENDTLDEDGLVEMLRAAFDNAIAVCLAGAAWHVAAPAGPPHALCGEVLKERGIWRQTIQWVKNNATFAPLGVCYHWRAEPIFFGWLPNGAHRYYGGRKQDTVWEIDRPTKSPEHPTMKPVELVARAIENHTRKGEIVLDIFCGSGTTLVACEQLGRKCRAVELAPKYCAVILERWSILTGKQPELIGQHPMQ